MVDLLERIEQQMADHDSFGGFTRHVTAARSDKKANSRELRLPPAVAAFMRHLDASVKPPTETRLAWFKTRGALKLLALLCFVRVHGITGLERWTVAKLSPTRRIARIALRRRTFRLYRASRVRAPRDGA